MVELNLEDPVKERLGEPSHDTQKDLLLLEDRMKGWEMHGTFHIGLRNAFHKRLSSTFVRQLEEQVDRWDGDTRDFHDEEIAQAWSDCKGAAESYVEKINFYMSYEENTDYTYLQVPTDLRDNGDHGEAYRKIFQELESARSALLGSLGVLYRIHHSKALLYPTHDKSPN